MFNLYKGVGIFASEEPVRRTTTTRLTKYGPFQCMAPALIVLFFKVYTHAKKHIYKNFEWRKDLLIYIITIEVKIRCV